jgi:hypothetical protein
MRLISRIKTKRNFSHPSFNPDTFYTVWDVNGKTKVNSERGLIGFGQVKILFDLKTEQLPIDIGLSEIVNIIKR